MDECKDVQKLKSWGLAITKYPSLPDHTEYPTRIIFKNHEYLSKQQLASWLEDKIKKYYTKIEECYADLDWYDADMFEHYKMAYQTVLDFINKGGKDE